MSPIEVNKLTESMDSWVKTFHTRLSRLEEYPVEEMDGNIQHNYELIKELMFEIERLRAEIELLKIREIE